MYPAITLVSGWTQASLALHPSPWAPDLGTHRAHSGHGVGLHGRGGGKHASELDDTGNGKVSGRWKTTDHQRYFMIFWKGPQKDTVDPVEKWDPLFMSDISYRLSLEDMWGIEWEISLDHMTMWQRRRTHSAMWVCLKMMDIIGYPFWEATSSI